MKQTLTKFIQSSDKPIREQMIQSLVVPCKNQIHSPGEALVSLNDDTMAESLDVLLNKCVHNRPKQPISSRCGPQLSEYSCRTIPTCSWNSRTKRCTYAAEEHMFSNTAHQPSHNRPFISNPLLKFPDRFYELFFWWNSLSPQLQTVLGGQEDSWSIRLYEMSNPSFGLFPKLFIRLPKDQARKIRTTLLSCGDLASMARMIIRYSQTHHRRWLRLIQTVFLYREKFPNRRFERMFYQVMDFLSEQVKNVPEQVILVCDLVIEWVKQATLFVHFTTGQERYMRLYGVSSVST